MKRKTNTFRNVVVVAALLSCSSLTAFGQDERARLRLDELNALEAKANRTIDVNIDGKTLALTLKALGASKDPKALKVRESIAGLRGIYVKSYRFDEMNAYNLEDIEAIRSQLRGPNWQRMAKVRSKRRGQNVDVYAMFEGDKLSGIAVISASDRELAIVNIVGPIDVEKLVTLSGNFGVPSVELETSDIKD